DAATAAAAHQDSTFLKAVAQAKESNAALEELVAIVAEHYARGGPVDSIAELIPALEPAQPELAEAIVQGLGTGWPKAQSPPMTEQLEASLVRLVDQLPPGSRGRLVRLAFQWGS